MTADNVLILEEAANDLLVGKAFYDRQKAGLGDYFFDSLISDIESLEISAGTHSRKFDFYRMLSRRFPFAIYYDFSSGIACVAAVLDMRSNPTRLRDRLARRP